MVTFETTDQKEVQRFRIAQFNGRTATFRSAGSTVTGLVRSIVENRTGTPPVWVVTLIPSEPKAKTALLHPAPRIRACAGEYR